ncbi:unnamed protein product [Rotaria magnacalcarata]|uniref:Uncharacterized protein n=1 Tax=Rotaria magnacalcarata TaxID=392030 RepID=A0A819U403_9BILA|nr:unnamed protein product [Rotaria magnacalcarata]CAF2126704.1 unnamed protein product [Rotaria magnacalcarata]CAF3845688.1 unnamed protein product [Rotaria magnacalcarata]CAF3970334.1 unnamed protein product [Rotaria magnacalcarata]CAF3976865.1 unnamed protein product [Rotaria magnacalcarata]
MAPTRGARKSETAAASSLSIENQLLADIDESINFDDDENQTKDDGDSNECSFDPFSTKQFQSKRRRGFRKKPRPFSEDDIEALQQLSCAKAFSKFHSRIKREAETDESIGDYLKACALLATKLRHCKNEFLEGDNADQQIESYYKDRIEEYSTLSKQEFLNLAERYKSDIHHTIDKWLKKRSKSRSHAKKNNPGEYKRNMLSDALQALANK